MLRLVKILIKIQLSRCMGEMSSYRKQCVSITWLHLYKMPCLTMLFSLHNDAFCADGWQVK